MRFDAHCHLFDLKYLLLEAGEMLKHGHLVGNTKHGLAASGEKASPRESQVEGVKRLLQWIKGLGLASLGPEEAHLKAVLQAASEASQAKEPVLAVSLMMDIFYMYHPPLKTSGTAAPPVLKALADGNAWRPATLQDACETDLDQALDHVVEVFRQAGHGAGTAIWVRQRLKEHHEKQHERTSSPEGANAAAGYYDTAGFAHQREALIRLKRNPAYADRLVPFFAVDPRRPGVIHAITSGEFVGKASDGKPFQGVKIYPRLGYEPGCAELQPLFAWCEANQIPIISHCDSTGFPSEAGDSELGDPNAYKAVLQRFPGLIIDLAHIGWSGAGWPEKILTLMARYDDVYTDIACYTHPDEPQEFKNKYWDSQDLKARSLIRSRTLFGTDFDVFYFTCPGISLGDHYQRFMKIFGQDLNILCSANPARFLRSVMPGEAARAHSIGLKSGMPSQDHADHAPDPVRATAPSPAGTGCR